MVLDLSRAAMMGGEELLAEEEASICSQRIWRGHDTRGHPQRWATLINTAMANRIQKAWRNFHQRLRRKEVRAFAPSLTLIAG